MTPEQRTLLENTADDLRYLQEAWGLHADDHTLRRASVTLRFLVIDQWYGRAWRAAGFERQPRIAAIDLSLFLNPPVSDWIAIAFAGGGAHNGLNVGPAFSFYGVPPPEIEAEVTRLQAVTAHPPSLPMPLARFPESVCMYVWGVPVARRHIIQYVAHALGGAHYHMDRAHDHAHDLVFQVLDAVTEAPSGTPMRIDRHLLVYNELLSIGRCLALAPDTQAFLGRTSELL